MNRILSGRRAAATSGDVAAPQPRAAAEDVAAKLAALPTLSTEQLRAEWRRLYRTQPPRLSRDLMVRALAYRLQELAYGGLSKATKRRLLTLAKSLQDTGRVAPDPGTRLKPGARLVREWHGRTHTVTVAEQGFAYRDRTYASLSAIARDITGAHWSGPRFFGLKANRGGEHG